MTTPYTEIVPLSRAAIGDYGVRNALGVVQANSYDNHADDITLAINYILLMLPDYSGNGTVITPTLATDNDKGALATCVALILVLPNGTFSMDAPNMKYWTQANTELLSYLLGRINYFMSAGDVSPSIWGTLDQYYNQGQLIADRITDAVGNY